MVTIDDDVFGFDGYHSHESFVVTGRFAPDDALSALGKAAARFMLVDEEGTEHPDDEDVMTDLYDRGIYTPNYVATPRLEADGIHCYVDCKGSIEEPMAATFRRILREELSTAGITDAAVRVDAV
ncbi:MAG TPA: hypothetical protein VF228_01535 [Iamia sp.]